MEELIARLERPGSMLETISLWQPWASLWCSDAKRHETRHWPTSHRGWMGVQAAKRPVDDFSGDRLDDICDGLFGNHWGHDLPRGAIVGVVRLVGCTRTDDMPIGHQSTDDYECGDFSPGRFAWERSTYLRFREPVPYRGAQGIFKVPGSAIVGAIKSSLTADIHG